MVNSINDNLTMLDTNDMAKILRCSREKVRRLNRAGKILDGSEIGSTYLWNAEEVRDWQKAGCPNAKEWDEIKSRQLTEV